MERGVGGDCPIEDGGECVVVDLAEEDEAAAAEDGVVDGEGGILGGGTYFPGVRLAIVLA